MSGVPEADGLDGPRWYRARRWVLRRLGCRITNGEAAAGFGCGAAADRDFNVWGELNVEGAVDAVLLPLVEAAVSRARQEGQQEALTEALNASDERLTIFINDNVKMSPRKMAAQAVHAALYRFGVGHGAVVVLGSSPTKMRRDCDVLIEDAGVTELKPGTLTAGVARD